MNKQMYFSTNEHDRTNKNITKIKSQLNRQKLNRK